MGKKITAKQRLINLASWFRRPKFLLDFMLFGALFMLVLGLSDPCGRHAFPINGSCDDGTAFTPPWFFALAGAVITLFFFMLTATGSYNEADTNNKGDHSFMKWIINDIRKMPKWRKKWFPATWVVAYIPMALIVHFIYEDGGLKWYHYFVQYILLLPLLASWATSWILTTLRPLFYKRGKTKKAEAVADKKSSAAKLVLSVNPDTATKYRMAPTFLYYLRAFGPSAFGFSVIFLFLAFFVIKDVDGMNNWQYASCWLAPFAAVNVFWILLVKHRPYILVGEEGMDVVVDGFFDNTFAKWAYSGRGYDLGMMIDYAQSRHIDWDQLKSLRIEKRYGVYKVHAVGRELKGIVLYATFSKKKAAEFKKYLRSFNSEVK